MYTMGQLVRYVGPVAALNGLVVHVAEITPGGYRVGIHGQSITKPATETEIQPVSKRTTTVTHPDGTQSTRSSATMAYTHAVEVREDMWATAKVLRAEASEKREEKARFIAAVRAGRIATQLEFSSVYLLGEGDEKWWLGGPEGDRKAAVRGTLKRFDEAIAKLDTKAEAAESGPQFRYGVLRWSQSETNAAKSLNEWPTSTVRVVPVDRTV